MGEARRVLVTGGAGFIGSELVRGLAAAGHPVRVVDNLINGRRENLEGVEGDVELIVADIRERPGLPALMRGVEVVFHLACLGVRHSIREPAESHDVNATATLSLLSAARAADVGRFVYVSSSEVYGTARHAPMTEEHPTFPTTVYGASKLAGECYARAFFETYGYPAVVIRPFNTYGPRCHHEGDSGEVIPKFLLRGMAGLPLVVFGDGTQTRDFTHVGDTAGGILRAGFTDGILGETINLGSGKEIAIRDLARKVGEVLERPVETTFDAPRPGDVLRLCADASRARRLLGFRPEVTLERGLASLLEWYRGLGVSPETLLEREVVHAWDPGEVGGGASS